ncbi:hypothetical protein BH23CHL8_BH23CHL8_14430 [soil metagenome]
MSSISRQAVTAPRPGDERVTGLVSERFDALMATWPGLATYLGVHQHDGRLADLSREATEADMGAEAAFISALDGVAHESLSAHAGFERDVALHAARLRLFMAEVHREWERRASAVDEVGDGLFMLLARDFAPLRERLDPMTDRLEAAPAALRRVRDRLGPRPVRLWNEMEIAAAGGLPTLINEVVAAGRAVWSDGQPELRRLERAAEATRAALADYTAWLTSRLAGAVDEFALGAPDLDRLIALRAFDGLASDDILAIGTEQLAAQHRARREAAAEIDPHADEAEVMEGVKRDGPADFEAALRGYREAMFRARDFVGAHDLATLPEDEVLEVLPTPRYLRGVIPFAAYFGPPAFDRPARGVYVVTPSVDGHPGAMLEPSWSSIVNTSIHEAYPGHHPQHVAALTSASPARLLVDAPEFVEGWGLYSEQLMLEHGFEDTAQRRVIVATDAIWRAARIILDIRLQRGEIGVAEAVDFLVEHTGFERPNAAAEVSRYTRTPAYNLSYLLGKVLLLRLRDEEQRRLGGAFSLRGFHDAMLYSGSLPISFQRRLLRGEGGGPAGPSARPGA